MPPASQCLPRKCHISPQNEGVELGWRRAHALWPPLASPLLPTEPKFVGAHLVPDNEDRADDKVYFFFSERAQEAERGAQALFARVGRLCVVSGAGG